MAFSPFLTNRYRLEGLSKHTYLNGTKGRVEPPATNSGPGRLVFIPENGSKLLVKLENLRFVQENPFSLEQQELPGISNLEDQLQNMADGSSHLYVNSPFFNSMSGCVPTDQQIRHVRRALDAAEDWQDTAADIVPTLLAQTYQENGFLLKAANAVANGELLYLVHHALTSTQEICEHLQQGFDGTRVYRCTENNPVGYMLNTRSEQDLVQEDVRKEEANMCLPPKSLILVFPFVKIETKHAHVRFGMRIFRPEDLNLRVERPCTFEEVCRIAEDNADHNQRLCACCLQLFPNLEYCAGCKKVFYCSRDCQKKDWKQHKSYCKQVRKAREAREAREA